MRVRIRHFQHLIVRRDAVERAAHGAVGDEEGPEVAGLVKPASGTRSSAPPSVVAPVMPSVSLLRMPFTRSSSICRRPLLIVRSPRMSVLPTLLPGDWVVGQFETCAKGWLGSSAAEPPVLNAGGSRPTNVGALDPSHPLCFQIVPLPKIAQARLSG
jgi:hypothetical protein